MALYREDLEQAIAGMKYGLNSETESFAAGEDIRPGDPLFGMTGDDKVCYKAHINAVSVTASADLVSGNIITMVINGVTLDPVAFAETSEKTIRNLVDAIDQNDSVRALGIDAFFLEGEPRTVKLQSGGVDIDAKFSVSFGGSKAVFTVSAYTDMKFIGVARFEHLSYREGAGFYPKDVSVSVQTRGKVFVRIADASHPDDKKAAYVALSGKDAGKFTDVSEGNYDSGCIFRSARANGDLALVELRGMK